MSPATTELMDFFNKALINYGTPNGFGGANGLFGIVQRKHMETYGTRREDFGRIAVGQRASAKLNENALLRGSMTIEDYLDARVIADPIRLYDCVLPCAGADAVVVGPLDRVPAGKGVPRARGLRAAQPSPRRNCAAPWRVGAIPRSLVGRRRLRTVRHGFRAGL